MHFVIAYDVSDDRKRLKIARILDNFGDRVQGSVFELPAIDRNLLAACLKEVDRIELSPGDSVRVYPLCEACRKGIILRGADEAMQIPEVYIV